MKPGLQLQLGQQLTMTPQLQQAIRLLQLSTLDLRQEIQEAIETNPLLELDEDAPLDAPEHDDDAVSEVSGADDAVLDDYDSQVDVDWDDVYTEAPSAGAPPDDEQDWEQRTGSHASLEDHLLWQLNLARMSDSDRLIAYAIIEALDERGYLIAALDDIAATARREWGEPLPDADYPEPDEVLAVLHRVQQFDPPGVAARDLAECLALQLQQLPARTPWRTEALALTGQLALLEAQDLPRLRRELGLSEDALAAALGLLRQLHPAPGETIAPSEPEHTVPDVVVRRVGRRWRVELNTDILPKVRLNPYYSAAANRPQRDEDSSYLRGQLQEARWFLKSLQSRNETLLKVAARIVEVQQDFFNYGEEAMKPLVLADIAQAVEMHESTISRVTTQKFMLTPRGLFELKFFFSSHVGTDGGGECSSTAIRAIIRKLVAAEDPKKPLSDSKLASLLNDQGIQVARRTIAKYREAMKIPASSERKRLV
ncbi:RNA polymerase factor sigma-54 [Isoalcanivorax beigongshangi]|uniref:RNA polymerase sigma-54 factor n=1 Tax=Isoalcanivorax beigongshangi TaxID=3238810 RepID=A0ABV4AIK3_9GAMM